MIESASRDYMLYYGEDWQETMVLYADLRVTRWRGAYDKDFLYKIGDGAQISAGAAYVALLETQRAEPGTEGTALFWSPLTPHDLTGCTDQIVCEAIGTWPGFTVTPEAQPLLGRLNVDVPYALFAAAPSSAHFFLKHTDAAETVSYPLRGTLLFKKP